MIFLAMGVIVGFFLFLAIGYSHDAMLGVLLGCYWFAAVIVSAFFVPPPWSVAHSFMVPLFLLPIPAYVIGYLANQERTETFRIRVSLD